MYAEMLTGVIMRATKKWGDTQSKPKPKPFTSSPMEACMLGLHDAVLGERPPGRCTRLVHEHWHELTPGHAWALD